MSSSTDYVNYILEQLSCAGLARARRMFGEYGLYLDGMFSQSSVTTSFS